MFDKCSFVRTKKQRKNVANQINHSDLQKHRSHGVDKVQESEKLHKLLNLFLCSKWYQTKFVTSSISIKVYINFYHLIK